MLFSSCAVAIGQISKLRIMHEEMRGWLKCSGDAPTVAASLSSQRPKLCSEARPQQPIMTQSPQGWFHIIKPHKLSCPVIIFNDSLLTIFMVIILIFVSYIYLMDNTNYFL